jgi:acylaminoacyl-peptidase
MLLCGAALALTSPLTFGYQGADRLELLDVFELEWVSDPQISPDGDRVVYARNFNDIMADTSRSNLWIADVASGESRPLTTGTANDFSPRWSPDGSKLLYVSTRDGGAEIWLRWMDTGQTAKLTSLVESPGGVSWSPDGRWIAFSMFVPSSPEPLATLPPAPPGADWAEPARVMRRLRYRADGAGYLPHGFRHVFVLSADGGTPRQLTSGDFNHGGSLSWTPDSSAILLSANRREDWDIEGSDSDVYRVSLEGGELTRLTDRFGPDNDPVISPDGGKIAWTGYDERYQGYQVTRLYVMNSDGSEKRVVSGGLDRDVQGHVWRADGSGLFFQYDDEGNTKVAFMSLDGEVTDVARNVGGLSLGRPYTGGSFSLASDDTFAFTISGSNHPADLAVGEPTFGGGEGGDDGGLAGRVRRLTDLNADLLDHKQLGEVEMFWYESRYDQRPIQGWVVTPPDFDPSQRYPLILEIHGGPFAAYSDFFAAEVQLFAAAGYVVLYTNPRGSTSYGEEFGNLIHHAYPSQDFDDLMSGVDAVLERGYVDPQQLFVTGGSGGGVLTAWIVGHTDRFAAAVAAKPVINWYSFVLTADIAPVYKTWFPGLPWDNLEHYMERSPLHHVGNVTTPTMLLTGEVDYRTPMSESEQFYTALKLRGIDSALVRIPEASHGIASRPSYLMSKVAHILAWFARYR